jgi:hypothetical protein
VAVDARGVVYINSEDGHLYALNQGGTLRERLFPADRTRRGLHAAIPRRRREDLHAERRTFVRGGIKRAEETSDREVNRLECGSHSCRFGMPQRERETYKSGACGHRTPKRLLVRRDRRRNRRSVIALALLQYSM